MGQVCNVCNPPEVTLTRQVKNLPHGAPSLNLGHGGVYRLRTCPSSDDNLKVDLLAETVLALFWCRAGTAFRSLRTLREGSSIPNTSPFAHIDRDRLPYPSEAVVALAQRLARVASKPHQGAERRSEPRQLTAIPVIVQPVNDKFQAEGEPFRAITHSVSTLGIDLLHSREVDAKFLALEFTRPGSEQSQPIQVIMQVLRCRPLGPSMCDIGGTFVSRLEADEPHNGERSE